MDWPKKIVLVALFFPYLCWGGRVAYPPLVQILGRVDFTKDYLSNPIAASTVTATWADRLGSAIYLEIALNNISGIKQTGTFEIPPGKIVAGAYCGGSAGTYYFKTLLSLCGNDKSTDISLPFKVVESNLSSPPHAQWKLAAGERVTLRAILAVEGSVGEPPTTGCPSAYAIAFNPTLKITVNEDQGAVLASMGYYHGGINTGASYVSCGGGTFANSHFDGDYPEVPGIPILINGGRPF